MACLFAGCLQVSGFLAHLTPPTEAQTCMLCRCRAPSGSPSRGRPRSAAGSERPEAALPQPLPGRASLPTRGCSTGPTCGSFAVGLQRLAGLARKHATSWVHTRLGSCVNHGLYEAGSAAAPHVPYSLDPLPVLVLCPVGAACCSCSQGPWPQPQQLGICSLSVAPVSFSQPPRSAGSWCGCWCMFRAILGLKSKQVPAHFGVELWGEQSNSDVVHGDVSNKPVWYSVDCPNSATGSGSPEDFGSGLTAPSPGTLCDAWALACFRKRRVGVQGNYPEPQTQLLLLLCCTCLVHSAFHVLCWCSLLLVLCQGPWPQAQQLVIDSVRVAAHLLFTAPFICWLLMLMLGLILLHNNTWFTKAVRSLHILGSFCEESKATLAQTRCMAMAEYSLSGTASPCILWSASLSLHQCIWSFMGQRMCAMSIAGLFFLLLSLDLSWRTGFMHLQGGSVQWPLVILTSW